MASRTAPPKGAAQGTMYTIFLEAEGSWTRYGESPGRRGDEAIKAFTKAASGDSHKAGLWHAIPSSTVTAEANTLEIVTETKTVSSFKRPGSSNGSAPTGTKDS